MPHVDDRVRHRLAVFGQNRPIDIQRLGFRAAPNVGAKRITVVSAAPFAKR
jgi:hypothetical protein